MTAIDTIRNILISQGIFEFYLPFLLTFSIFYALLVKIKIFGSKKPGPQISALVALIAGLYIMNTSIGISLSQFFAAFFAQASVLLTLIMVIGMTLGALSIPMILGEEGGQLRALFEESTPRLILGIVGILVVLAMFASNLVAIPGLPGFSLPGLSGDDIAVILLVLATFGIIFWVSRGVGNNNTTTTTPAAGGKN